MSYQTHSRGIQRVVVCLQLPQLVTVLPCEQMCHRPLGERQGGVVSVLYVYAAELMPSPVRHEAGYIWAALSEMHR